LGALAANLHADPYFSKVTAFPRKFPQDGRQALTNHRRDGPGAGRKRQGGIGDFGDVHAFGERPGKVPAHRDGQFGLGPRPQMPCGNGGVRGKDPGQRLRRGGFGHDWSGSRLFEGAECGGQTPGTKFKTEGTRLNIILVTGATARARTLTLDWRHWAVGGFSLFVVFLAFTFMFNFVTLKWAAAVKHPLLQSLVLADQREEAARGEEKVQGHLNAMALRLGDLQAQMMRLDGLSERLAKTAGLKPQELQSLPAGTAPGRGGAVSSLPSRNLSVTEFSDLVAKLGHQVDERSDQLSVLEALLVADSANRKFLPSKYPIIDGWYSSNFGYRIDPFTGQNSMHEGIDFPAETGTPIVAAASGKVAVAEWHPQYGKMLEIDHGNGLVSRYAHASQLLVKVGDLVVAGQRIAVVGTTGRSTGPHLHFEVRLNGTPQNPARFLQAPG